MEKKQYWKLGIFGVIIALLSLVIGIGLWQDANTCMGIRLLSEKECANLSCYQYVDLGQWLFHNSELAAIDQESSTIYISQPINKDTAFSELKGSLDIRLPDYELFFAPDAAFYNLHEAIASGHSFTLIAVSNEDTYMRYSVIFSTLPVLKMDGAVSGVNDEGRDVYSGDLCLWTPNDPDTERYSVKSSDAQWHARGQASLSNPKKSWKITLKTKSGDNRDLAMLGLGEDDDWILNAMFRDNTKIREKLIMDTWNEMQENTTYQLRMSSGEYVEVVANGHYQGIYLLQRRVDMKYLNLDNQTTSLFKGKGVFHASTPQDGYELIHSPFEEEIAYKKMEPFLYLMHGPDAVGAGMVHLDNWIDVSLFIQFGIMIDNYRFNNIFYILKEDAADSQLFLVPWDTDQSLGLYWRDGIGQTCEPDIAGKYNCDRIEKDNLLSIYPELHTNISDRWHALSVSIFEESAICGRAIDLYMQLEQSGALLRDQALWGIRFNGADTIQGLLGFLRDRIQWLNDYYS